MSKFNNAEKVGLRDKETKKIVAVYPHKAEGSDSEIEEKVKFWFYQQSCSAEDQLRDLFVDVVNNEENNNVGL
ncbi:hypothetical protein [Pseudobacteroides cellulosolvens]|uniref:Uncharacterized protein n=1 Tax=Pseudobacteroides cellulosolvens ATCC 35603 = DSM 2933 TaxID=398512 RepID=A0A0L6JK00_9FIRM|nr:hypothetical protein [Pseudobacteroides cellulosolvens]KNY26085.1 hypothetical protein Bccel_1347 [Pseudobacteroides cellulosolvens ATCC 35603 = DSM 2933]